MNILLIFPSSFDRQGRVQKYKLGLLPPLSLAILSRLTPSRHPLKVVNDIVEEIDFDGAYDLIGITAMTSQVERAFQIADEFRKRGKRVVMGGVHPTSFPVEAREHCDSVVIGEAENLWGKVLADAERDSLEDFYQEEGFPELNDLLIPRWDTMDLSRYPRNPGAKMPSMPIFTTRGCPFGCKFCIVTKMNGKSYRTKPIAHVLEELDQTRAKDYFIVDDNIACFPDYSRELFRSIRKRNITWMSQASTTVLNTPDLIDLAGKSGCYQLVVGIESLSKASLKTMNKGFNQVEKYEELIARMKKAGISPLLSFIFGFDQDPVDQYEETLKFLRKNQVGQAAFWILTPNPGTDVHLEMEKAGRLVEKRLSLYDGTNVVYSSPNASREEIERNFWRTYQSFYSFTGILVNTFHNVMISRRPLSELFRNLFIQGHFWRKAAAFDHPYSGGFFKISGDSIPISMPK